MHDIHRTGMEPGASRFFRIIVSCRSYGANGRNRTGDLLITNQLLYQLSYVGPLVLRERHTMHRGVYNRLRARLQEVCAGATGR